jgi:hypothetical protein
MSLHEACYQGKRVGSGKGCGVDMIGPFNTEPKMRLRARLTLVFIALLTTACAVQDYEATMRNAHADLPLAKEFSIVYPTAKEFISYFTGTHGRPSWHSEVGIYQRYTLTMQFPLTISMSRTHSSQDGEAQFYLAEVASVERLPDGRFSILYGHTSKVFGLSEWKQLQEAGGDLSALNIAIEKDKPVPFFEKALVAK